MELNKETALRLWNKSFGKKTKVRDFAGREIAKGAYNDRNSNYGWNVDHIFPVSRGGKTADYNLVVCNIATNDEKADRFPAFKANGKQFEIRKVENHYEIFEKDQKTMKSETDDKVNLLDSASGIRYFNKLKNLQNKRRWVGDVNIRLEHVTDRAVIDFIEQAFEFRNIKSNGNIFHEWNIQIKGCVLPQKEDIQNLLDKCVLLNTYLKSYFVKNEYVLSYDITYSVRCIDYIGNIPIHKISAMQYSVMYPNNCLYINNEVYINTCAKDDEPDLSADNCVFLPYDYVFTKLAKNLEREVGE